LYYIGSGVFDWSVIFTESEPGCQVNYQLTQTGMTAGNFDTTLFTLTTDAVD